MPFYKPLIIKLIRFKTMLFSKEGWGSVFPTFENPKAAKTLILAASLFVQNKLIFYTAHEHISY